MHPNTAKQGIAFQMKEVATNKGVYPTQEVKSVKTVFVQICSLLARLLIV